MIEPYGTAIRTAADKFAKLRFSLRTNTDYGAKYSDGFQWIEIATDRYMHPSLSMCLRDERGRTFELGSVRRILAPAQLDLDNSALKSIREEFGLDKPETPQARLAQGISDYVHLLMNQVLDFLIEFDERVFATRKDYEAEYAERASTLMGRLRGN